MKSPIHENHVALKASFTEEHGWEMPKTYNSMETEVKHVRSKVGIVDISHRGKLKFTGKDHIRFLQGMLSNDIVKLCIGEGIYATLLTPKGKILADMVVYKNKEHSYIDLPSGLNSKIKEHFLRYRLSFQTDIEDITYNHALFHICGPNAISFLSNEIKSDLHRMKKLEFKNIKINSIPVSLHKINRSGEVGFDLVTTNDNASKLWEHILIAGQKYNLEPFGIQSLETLRIEAGIPVWGKELDEDTFPLEAELWDALSFDKGCYIGQEVTARIRWRGKVNRHLVGLIIESKELPSKGDLIYKKEKIVGKITSSTYSPTLGTNIALSYIKREYKKPDTSIHIHLEESKPEAKIVELPFYKRND